MSGTWRTYRSNRIIYPELYYLWTYKSTEDTSFFKENKRDYPKHLCGVGFYSIYHAKHVISYYYNKDVLSKIHIIKGSKLISKGITLLNDNKYNRVYLYIEGYIPDPYIKIRRWVYPPEFGTDKHRRRKFIISLTQTFDKKGVEAFNKKYKSYFNGFKKRISPSTAYRKGDQIRRDFVQEFRKAYGLPKDGIYFDKELLSAYREQNRSLSSSKEKQNKREILGESGEIRKRK